MKNKPLSYQRHRFPFEVISHAVWLYHRFCLSFREVEVLLAERGITVTYETIRRWCQKFGPGYARMLKKRQGRLGDTWPIDEVFITIQGQRQYLWRAVDQDGDVIDILVQPRRNQRPMVKKLMRPRRSRISTVHPVFPEYKWIGSQRFLGLPGAKVTHCFFPDDGVPDDNGCHTR